MSTDMTTQEFEEILDFVQTTANIELLKGDNSSFEKLDHAVTYMRKAFIRDHERDLWISFRTFEKELWTAEAFFRDVTWVSVRWNIAIRRFNNRYYVVKILNDNKYFGEIQILETESPDDFPMHAFPEDYISSQYPEIAMVKAHEKYSKEVEVD